MRGVALGGRVQRVCRAADAALAAQCARSLCIFHRHGIAAQKRPFYAGKNRTAMRLARLASGLYPPREHRYVTLISCLHRPQGEQQ
jgi:hypothetical protein